jgi:oxaloacetate decarboxylase gamma subunit
MEPLLAEIGFQQVLDQGGVGIALTGLTIVFLALVLISIFIAWLPRILELVDPYLPEASDHHTTAAPAARAASQASQADDAELAAAIGFVLHSEMERR